MSFDACLSHATSAYYRLARSLEGHLKPASRTLDNTDYTATVVAPTGSSAPASTPRAPRLPAHPPAPTASTGALSASPSLPPTSAVTGRGHALLG